ncbi:UNVERIFIED_ORG: hypothetical protein QOE_2448 [Clostridioides difficile F501]
MRVHRFPFACETVAPHYNAPAPAALCEAEQNRTDVSRETSGVRTVAIMRPCRTSKRTNVSRETFEKAAEEARHAFSCPLQMCASLIERFRVDLNAAEPAPRFAVRG